MKGGNCCKFETAQGACPTDGIYHSKKNTVTYCSVISDVYVFYIYHAFKHMDEFDIDCYDIHAFRDFIIQHLSTSFIYNIESQTNPGDARILKLPDLFEGLTFEEARVSELENGRYVSLTQSTLNNDHIFFVFEKDDESITIFTLGNCQIDVRDDVIAYIPIFTKNENDDDIESDNANRIHGVSSIDNIENFISGQKLRSKSPTLMKQSLVSTKKSHTKKSHKMKKSTRKKENPELKLGVKLGVKSESELTEELEFLKIKSLQTRMLKFENMGSKILIENISDIPLANTIMDASSIDFFSILFKNCTFDEEITVSDKLDEIVIFQCNKFPSFTPSNITSVFIINCRNIDCEKIARIPKIDHLNISRVRTPLLLTPLRGVGITMLKISECEVLDFHTIAPTFEPLHSLCLRYTNISNLPPLDKLLNLIIITETKTKIDIKNIKTLRICEIRNNDTTFINDECFVEMSKTFLRQILEKNLELTEKHSLVGCRKLNTLDKEIIKYAGISSYIFSPNLIFSLEKDKFVCPFIQIFNSERDHLPSIEDSFRDITADIIQQFYLRLK